MQPRCNVWRALLISTVSIGLATARPASLDAQASSAIRAHLPPALDSSVKRIADSVSAFGVPREPLMSKAAEGVLKGVGDARILDVVRRFAGELADARAALGTCATTPELVAAASVLHAGVAAPVLTRVQRAAGKCSTSERLVMPFFVLADMVARHVTPDVAIAAIEPLVERGARDAQFANLQSAVQHDIDRGQPPDAAARGRSAAVLRTLDVRPPR